MCEYSKLESPSFSLHVRVDALSYITLTLASGRRMHFYLEDLPITSVENAKYAEIEPSLFDFYYSEKYNLLLIFCKFSESGEL